MRNQDGNSTGSQNGTWTLTSHDGAYRIVVLKVVGTYRFGSNLNTEFQVREQDDRFGGSDSLIETFYVVGSKGPSMQKAALAFGRYKIAMYETVGA